MPLPSTIEQDISELLEASEAALILEKLSILRESYNRDRAQALSDKQAEWDKATEIQSRAGDENQAAMDTLIEQLAIVTSERDQLAALRADLTTKGIAAAQSGSVEAVTALLTEFLTPEANKIRAGLLAQKAQIEAQLESLPK